MAATATAKRLIPDQPMAEYVQELIPLDQLVIDDDGPQPDSKMIDTVRRWGILQPLLVQFKPKGKAKKSADHYYVVDGRRRVIAIATVKDEGGGELMLPCLVFPPEYTRRQILAARLVIHEHRHPNPIAELDAIKSLIAEGHDIKAIAGELGIPVATVNERMRLDKLSPKLAEWWRDGRMAYATAKKASNLASTLQDALVASAVKLGAKRITDDDVKEARLARRAPAASSLFQSMDDNLPAPLSAEARDAQIIPMGPAQVVSICQAARAEMKTAETNGNAIEAAEIAFERIETLMAAWGA